MCCLYIKHCCPIGKGVTTTGSHSLVSGFAKLTCICLDKLKYLFLSILCHFKGLLAAVIHHSLPLSLKGDDDAEFCLAGVAIVLKVVVSDPIKSKTSFDADIRWCRRYSWLLVSALSR